MTAASCVLLIQAKEKSFVPIDPIKSEAREALYNNNNTSGVMVARHNLTPQLGATFGNNSECGDKQNLHGQAPDAAVNSLGYMDQRRHQATMTALRCRAEWKWMGWDVIVIVMWYGHNGQRCSPAADSEQRTKQNS